MGQAKRKTLVGTVVSDKMDKTVVVLVERHTKHPVYRRTIKRSNRFKAHDENNQCRNGDKVKIIESRPLSKDKRWRVLEILQEAKQA